MAKKKTAFSGDRKDPKQNKSLAIRTVLAGMPTSKAAQVAEEVKKQFGHAVSVNQIYMIKTKMAMKPRSRGGRPKPAPTISNLGSAGAWVDAIRAAKQLLAATGSVDHAVALLKVIGS